MNALQPLQMEYHSVKHHGKTPYVKNAIGLRNVGRLHHAIRMANPTYGHITEWGGELVISATLILTNNIKLKKENGKTNR